MVSKDESYRNLGRIVYAICINMKVTIYRMTNMEYKEVIFTKQ